MTTPSDLTPDTSGPRADPAAAPGFATLGLSPILQQRVAAAGWAVPTEVQAATLPHILARRDVLGLAPTGSGKTAAYLLPLLQRLLIETALQDERPRWRPLRVLVLAPTRELAQQIFDVVHQLAPELRSLVAVGGVSINPQLMALRGGAHLIVATPGRLLDLVDHNAVHLDELHTLVLDEADRLLDLGFADELNDLLDLLPRRRQTLLFSATLPAEVKHLAAQLLFDPVQVDVRAIDGGHADAAAPSILQRAIEVDSTRRTTLLRHLIREEGWERVLVFVASQYASEHVADKLRQAGLPAASLHGDLSQGRRAQVLADFHARKLAVLVATDLAARGIDVPQLAVVVNHDLPRSTVDYTHRIGRTGRAADQGQAISFVCADLPGNEAHFRLIEKRQGQAVPREQVPGFEPRAPAAAPLSDPNGGVKSTRRKSKKDKLREAAAYAAEAAAARPRPPRR
jgi:superfamily II DNA/RNA helicase